MSKKKENNITFRYVNGPCLNFSGMYESSKTKQNTKLEEHSRATASLCIIWFLQQILTAHLLCAKEFQKNIYFCFIDYAKAFDCVDHNKLWGILKEMGIPDHLTCLLRNLDAREEVTVRTGHGTTDWFQIGKEYVKAVYCHPAYLTYMHHVKCHAG